MPLLLQGLPFLIGKNKKQVFAYLKERVWKRICSWKGRFLSRASKEILLKSKAQSIPSYCMSVFGIPISLCEELQRMMNSFRWGSNGNGHRRIHWLSWHKICSRKEFGGLGFRNLHCFNIAMLGQQGWKIISNPNAFLSRILKAKL
ncbi:hypothetical protein P3X46_004435 [Hevea brasiliensis]|uniref:Reverse transcriptase zinc-binding domain-containing protein n=1 Tax=Hevea brasiliensis TaxID=3981 RepID=A0ABQ9MY54_HEVBR|nr:hypothetical protein P3X46_004435 [Hevea brasiliensis]